MKNLKVNKFFNGFYGTYIFHDKNGLISGIGEVMTDEKKIEAIQDILIKNNREKNDCKNVYYVGDGYSDALAMKFVHNNGGKAIFVHPSKKNDKFYYYNNEIYKKLDEEKIIDFYCLADYTENSTLSNILQNNYIKN